MKTELINSPEVKEIDWSKPMVVKSKNSELTVWTNGEHTDVSFYGKVLIENQYHEVGKELSKWYKNSFTPITEPITVKFIP